MILVASTGLTGTIEGVWRRYKQQQLAPDREALILHYAPLVKFVAGRVGAGLPKAVEDGDLVSAGMFGLMDAIEKFDVDRGIRFESYAMTRIRGAIIDELRSTDWVPRSVRAAARRVERAIHDLEIKNGAAPTDVEIAKQAGVTLEELQAIYLEMTFTGLVAFDEILSPGDDTLSHRSRNNRSSHPEIAHEAEELSRVVRDAIRRLPERERAVLGLYYFEGLTMSEIGEVLDVSESRVCQIHSKAVLHLRSRMSVDREGAG